MVNLIEVEKNTTPNGWEVVKIGDIFKFSSGKSRPKNTSKEKTEEFNIPVYGGNGILGYSNKIFLNHPTLILGRVGEYCGCAHLTETNSWISDNALYAKECVREVDLIFMKNCFEYINLNQYSNKMGQPLITQGIIKDIRFGLPPLPEQRKIAHVLCTVQKAIEQQDNLIRTTTELKKALMQTLFTEGTRGEPLKLTEIGLVPESWEVKTIGEFSKLYTGGTPSTKNKNYYCPKEIPWMKSGEITGKRIKSVSNFISKEGMNSSNARLLPPDSVVIALNGRGKTRGTTAILDFECSCNQSVVCISPHSKEELNTEFLHYYLSYLYEFIRNLTGDNDRSGLSMAKIRQIPLMVPKIMEQIEIGNALQGLDNKIEILEKKKQTLTALFKTLLHELMTGQRRVHELEFDAHHSSTSK